MQHLQKNAGGGCTSFFFESFARHVPRDSSPFALCSCALFCTLQKPTLLFSSNSALFRKNTRGWGVPLLNALLNRRSPRPIWRFKFFFFSRLSAFRNEPLAMRLAFSLRMYSIYAALGGCVQQQAASRFQDRHVHGRQQRKSTGNATERLPFPPRIQLQPQGYRPQLFVARFVQR